MTSDGCFDAHEVKVVLEKGKINPSIPEIFFNGLQEIASFT